jgi:hypothetical protein
MINETITVSGRLQMVLTGPDGTVKEDKTINNLVVTTGKNFIASRMINDQATTAIMSHMALGSDNTAAIVGQTALTTELGARVALADAVSGAEVTYTATFGAGVSTGAIVEAGIFNASSSGTMACRTVFSVVNKGSDDTLAITWNVTIT